MKPQHNIFFVTLVLLLLAPFANALGATPDGGFNNNNSVDVTLTAAPGNIIKYTTDGTNPATGGTIAGDTVTVTLNKRPNTPTSFATNPETSLYGFPNPTSTIKATVLRATEINPATNQSVANITRTFFLGMNYTSFTLPVFSVTLEDAYLQGYEQGMFVKGSTYYNDLAANGGNPTDPFRPANWNNDSDRFPGHVEMYRDGVRFIDDNTMMYPSGRWSAALAKKSLKIKYDNAVGPSTTTVLLFGNQSPTSMNKVWLKQGGQDFDGLGMRDCIAAETITDGGLRVEETQCAMSVLFINGEFYGVMNINQDIDAKYLANRYGISKNDVVLLEQDGLVEEGTATDNQPYFALKNWLLDPTTNLSDPVQYANFTAQVNPESLIDHMIVQIYFQNDDYPNDYRMWRNKKVTSQVPGTPYDGRWYFQPKDLDQSVGLYAQIAVGENTLQEYLDKPLNNYGIFLFKKAMENPTFRQAFIDRSFELVNGGALSSQSVNNTVDRLAASRRPEVPKDVQRWQKPNSWESRLVDYKTWMAQREGIYLGHVTSVLGMPTNITLPPNTTVNETGNGTNTSDPYVIIAQLQANITALQLQVAVLQGELSVCQNSLTVCTESLANCQLNGTNTTPPVTTINYTLYVTSSPLATLSINGTVVGGTPKTMSLVEGSYNVSVSTPGFYQNSTVVNMNQNRSVDLVLGSIPVPPPVNTTSAVNVSIAAWYPKVKSDGTHFVFACGQSLNATKFDWYTYKNGIEYSKNLNIGPSNTVYKILPTGSGLYDVTCVAKAGTVVLGNGTLAVVA